MANSGQIQSGQRKTLRVRSVGASAVVAVAVLLAIGTGSTGYWLLQNHRHGHESQRRQRLVALAELLGRGVEAMLENNQLSAVRGLVVEIAQRYELKRARLVLPDGTVIADSEPNLITADLPPHTGTVVTASTGPSRTVHGELITVTLPLIIAGRTEVRLELTAPLQTDTVLLPEVQAGMGLAGTASLILLLLGYRQARARLLAMWRIRDALLCQHYEKGSGDLLEVAPALGDEAIAWNKLVVRQRNLERRELVEQVQEDLGNLSKDTVDLAGGCNAMGQGLLLVDDRLCIRYANRAAALFLQAEHGKMTGQLLTEWLVHEPLIQACRDAVLPTSKRRSAIELDRDTTDGHTGGGVLRFTTYPLSDESETMIVIEDVTQQRVAELSRKEFVAQATHELRTPLTNIRLYVETAIDEGARDRDLLANCLNVINQETGRLERIVSDILSVAEIEAGSLQINRDDVRLDEVLAYIESDYRAAAESKGIQLTVTVPPKVPVIQGDREKLAAAVHNLVGNALKYTSDSGRISVTLEVANQHLMLEVADNGIGISPDDITNVFEKFCRAADDRISGITGSGLGLSLAREVVRLHGGDITLESQLDQGSTFTVSLPCNEGLDV